MRSFVLGLLPVAALVGACSSTPREDVAGSDDASLISCRDRRPPHPPVVEGDLWQTVWLPVLEGRQGVDSISRMMNTANGGEEGFQALMMAKMAAKDDLVCLESLLRHLAGPTGIAPRVTDFRADGRYIGTDPITVDWRDLQRVGWLIANIFTRVTRGIDVAAATTWDTTTVPVEALVSTLLSQRTGHCGPTSPGESPYGSSLAVSIVRKSDTDADAKVSMVEMQRWYEKTYAVSVRIDEGGVSLSAPTISDEASYWLGGLACLHQVLRQTNPTPPPQPDPVTFCQTIDLLANQGRGVTFTGTTVSVNMGGPPDYQIVMLSGRLVGSNAKRNLCVRDDDELKLYVPYRQYEISECGLVNGVYRAAYYHLDPRVWQDNWAP